MIQGESAITLTRQIRLVCRQLTSYCGTIQSFINTIQAHQQQLITNPCMLVFPVTLFAPIGMIERLDFNTDLTHSFNYSV